MELDLKKLNLRNVNDKLQNLDRKKNERDFTIINPEGNHAICAGLKNEMNVNINFITDGDVSGALMVTNKKYND